MKMSPLNVFEQYLYFTFFFDYLRHLFHVSIQYFLFPASILLLVGSEDDVPTLPPVQFEPLPDILIALLLKKNAIAILICTLFQLATLQIKKKQLNKHINLP